MSAKHPLIVISDPYHYNYDDFFDIVLEELYKENPCLEAIDILICRFIENSNELNIILSTIFNKVRSKATELGWDHSFEIDVLFNQEDYSFLHEQLSKVISCDEKPVIPHGLASLEKQKIKAIPTKETLESRCNEYKRHGQYAVTAIGGTFDHLHDGHKILLSLGVFGASHKVIVGITGPKLLTNKKYSEVLETFEERQYRVVSYLKKVMNFDLRFEIFQINDVCGPTGYVEDINLLVVSDESSKGGEFVNKTRREKGYKELDIIVIKVIGDENSNENNNWQGKLSSTDIRKQEYLRKYGKD